MTRQPAARPLTCSKCGSQVRIGEEAITWIDFGPAVLDPTGIVRAPQADTEGSVGEPQPHRTYAICTNLDCKHVWRLRRRFDGGINP